MRSFIKIILCLILFVSSVASARVIYGEDNRRDVYQETDNNLIRLSNSVAAMIPKTYFRGIFSEYKIKLKNMSDDAKMCSGEKFLQQTIMADCTGILVAPDQILTASHCLNTEKFCKDYRWVFSYKMKDEKKIDKSYKSKDNIYSCKNFITFNDKIGYTIVRLDRPVKNRSPIQISRNKLPAKNEELTVIGYPTGLPLKIASGGFISSYTQNGFLANLDTFSGNSGSPVFNKKTGELVGILQGGRSDYTYNVEKDCFEVNRCDDNGENCSKKNENSNEYVISAKVLPDIEN